MTVSPDPGKSGDKRAWILEKNPRSPSLRDLSRENMSGTTRLTAAKKLLSYSPPKKIMKKPQAGSKSSPSTRLSDPAARVMLANLCKKHSAFGDFYSDNKSRIESLSVTWTINSYAKNEGISSPATNTIILKRYPKSLADARIVAHEIVHLLIWNEGYPTIVADPRSDDEDSRRLDRFALVLLEPVFEPMVESGIKKYFRKLCAENATSAKKGLAKLIEHKETILAETADSRTLLYYSCMYARWRLLLESTCDKESADEYVRRFTLHFGETIVPAAEEIVELIRSNTTRSPESVRVIFETLLKNGKFTYYYQEDSNRFVIEE